jgi:4-hydroxybenzoate polyprenyltransferase
MGHRRFRRSSIVPNAMRRNIRPDPPLDILGDIRSCVAAPSVCASDVDPLLPLCVDLDGTLLMSDSLLEGALLLLKKRPTAALKLVGWMMKGKAHLKSMIASEVAGELQTLPVRQAVLEFLVAEHDQGRKLFLATGAHEKLAAGILSRFPLFSGAFCSVDGRNLTGLEKARELTRFFGEKRFLYAGNSRADLPVWKASAGAIVVSGRRLREQAGRMTPIIRVFPAHSSKISTMIRQLRCYQWVKNALIFLPILAAHQFGEWPLLSQAAIAFLSFSMAASAGYIFNDLLDLDADRRHPEKKRRPLASGDLPIRTALIASAALLIGSALLALLLSLQFLVLTVSYLAASSLYSYRLKKFPLVDVFVLSGLYMIRIFAGQLATGIPVSEWLLGFSLFLFLGLAMVKRYSELRASGSGAEPAVNGRGYSAEDSAPVLALGTSSSYLSVLVLALYIQSDSVTLLYSQPQILWFACPILLFWLSRLWLFAARGKMAHDPIIYAFRDPASYIMGSLLAISVIFAT